MAKSWEEIKREREQKAGSFLNDKKNTANQMMKQGFLVSDPTPQKRTWEEIRKERGYTEPEPEPKKPSVLGRLGSAASSIGKGTAGSYLSSLGTGVEFLSNPREWVPSLEEIKLNLGRPRVLETDSSGKKIAKLASVDEEKLQKLQQKRTADARQKYNKNQEIAKKLKLPTTTGLREDASKLLQSSSEDLARGKQGMGPASGLLYEGGVGAAQMGIDWMTSIATGVPMIPLIGARSFGQGADEARQEGASIAQQVGYGTLSAGIEMGTEKIFGGTSIHKKLMGEGFADSAADFAMDKLAKVVKASPRVAGIMKFVGNIAEEGTEEVISEIFSPVAKRIVYAPDTPDSTIEERMYAGLVGAISAGILGGAGQVIENRNSKAIDKEYKKVMADLPEDSPIRNTIDTIKNKGAAIDDRVKVWVVERAGGKIGFNSELDKLTQQNRPTIQAEQNENTLDNQTVDNSQTFVKTQNTASESILQKNNIFSIANTANPTEVKSKVYEYYKDLVSTSEISKPILNKNTGLPIEVSRATINQTFGADEKFRKASDNDVKIAAMENIVPLIENGEMQIVDASDKPSSKVPYANISGNLNVNGISHSVSLEVRRTDTGNKMFVHSVKTDVGDIRVTANKKSGMINNGYENQIDPTAYNILDRIGQATGIKVKIVPNIASPDGTNPDYANGQYDAKSNTLEISMTSENPAMVVAKHEITHMLQRKSPKLYQEYKDYVINSMKEAGTYDKVFAEMDMRHRIAGIEASESYIQDEIVADATETFLTDKAAIENLVRENRTLGQKILDVIREFIKKVDDAVKGVTTSWLGTEQFRTAERMWVEALNSVAETNLSKATKRSNETVKSVKNPTSSNNVKFSLKQPIEETKDLIAVHNIRENNLREMISLGGFPSPSIAIVKSDNHYGAFGEISVIFDKETINPADKRNLIYASDVYSKRFPTIDLKLNDKKVSEIKKKYSHLPDDSWRNSLSEIFREDNFERVNVDNLVDKYKKAYSLMQIYLTEKKIKLPLSDKDNYAYEKKLFDLIEDKEDYGKFISEIFESVIDGKYIRKNIDPFTSSGNRKSFKAMHEEYNLANILKRLLGAQRAQEGGFNSTGTGAIRATVTPQLKSIDEVKSRKDKIVSGEEFAAWKEENENKFYKLADELKEFAPSIANRFDYYDVFSVNISEAVKNGKIVPSKIKNEFDTYSFKGITSEAVRKIIDYLEFIKDAPTAYFEAKPQRIVDLDEVAAIVAPEGFAERNKELITGTNLNIVEYNANRVGDRLRAVNSVENVRFQLKDQSKDIERLKEINARLKEQFKLTKGVKLDKTAVKKLSRNILKDYGSSYSKGEFESRLYSLYDKIANDAIDFEEMQAETQSIARDILENVSVLNDTMHKEYAELRKTLRNTALTLPDKKYESDFKSYGGFDSFRKKNFGRLNLTNDGMGVDSFYQELSEMYPELFLKDIANPSDQLMLMSDVLDGLMPIYENPFDRDLNTAVEYLAAELFEGITDVPQAKSTYADMQKAKLDIAKAENKERIKQVVEQQKIKRDKAVADVKKRYEDEAYKTWWKNRLKENDIKSHYQQMIKEIRKEKNQKIDETASRYRERVGRIYEDRKMRDVKASIARRVKRLDALLRKPTQKKHINKALEKSIAELLTQIDFTTDRQGEKTELRLRDLRAEYEKIAKVSDEEGMSAKADEYIMEALEMLNGKRLVDMNLNELEIMYNIVSYFDHMVNSYNKAFVGGKWEEISTKSSSIMNELQTDKPVTESAYDKVQAFKDMMNWGMLTPQMFFRRMGNTFTELYSDIRTSLDKKIENTKLAQDYMKNLLKNTDKKTLQSWTGDKAETKVFDIGGGKTIELTPAQVMSLYLLVQREQARGHIFGLGIKAAPIVKTDKFTRKKSISKQFEPARVTPVDVQKMVASLSKEQRKIADGISKFLNTYSKQWVNEVTLQNYGYELAKEENYFPIKSDKDFLKSDFDVTSLDPTFTSMGFLKNIVKGAGNAIIIEDVFDVFTEHADKAATYNAFLTATENMKKVINFRTQDVSIKQSMNKKFGPQAFKYLQKLMHDLQGGIRVEVGAPIITSAMRTTKRAVLGLNTRTIVQQPTALIRATALINPEYLAKGIAQKSNMEEMREYSPIAWWKAAGYFDIDTGRSMKDLILDTEPKIDKISYAAIQKADDVTWGKLWNAVKLEIADTMPELKAGSQGYFEAVSERFSEIVDETQVVDTVLHRSDLMRQKDFSWKILTNFMAEPTKSFNMLLDSFDTYKSNRSSENKKKLDRTLAAYIATTLVNTFIISLVDLWRDDDKELKDTWLGNILNEVTGLLPIVRDIYSILQGYSIKRMEYEGLEKLSRSWNRSVAYTKELISSDKHKYPLRLIVKDWTEAVGYVTGVGVKNVNRELEAILRNYIKFTGNDGAVEDIYNFMFVK